MRAKKLRLITLLEPQYLQVAKIVNREMMANAEWYNALAPEQYCSQRGKNSRKHCLHKCLLFDLTRVKHAILVLTQRIDFDQLIKPICVPDWALRPYKNYKATIAGWGKEKNIWVSNLKETPVQIWSQEFCSGIMEQEWKNANKWHTVTKYCCFWLRKQPNKS